MGTEVYRIYNDDIGKQVATIYYDRGTKHYSSEVLVKESSPILFARCDGGIHWGECPNPPEWCIENWLKGRVIPENRMMLKEVLLAHGIHKYDWRVLIKLNHGRTVSDPFSVEVEEFEGVEG